MAIDHVVNVVLTGVAYPQIIPSLLLLLLPCVCLPCFSINGLESYHRRYPKVGVSVCVSLALLPLLNRPQAGFATVLDTHNVQCVCVYLLNYT